MKKAKKIMSVILTVMLAFSCIPMSAISVGAEETSTELTATIDTGEEVTLKDTDDDSYYEIGTADELYAFEAIVNGGNTSINVILTTDIVVNDGVMTAESTDARVWKPIGKLFDNSYSGVFEGNNKTISGLYFNDNTVDQVGLFGCINEHAQIMNMGVINSYFNGKEHVGGVVAFIDKYAAVKDCYNESTVKGASNVGGVVGTNEYSTLVENCYNTGNVYGDENVGGIVGYACGLIENCYNTGSIESSDQNVGGIVGTNFNDVKFCYNAGSVKGDYFVGGIVGDNECGINCCYNVGSVSGNSRVGGIVGINNLEAKNSYNAGSISGDEYVGGVFGQNWMRTITNCCNTGSVSGNVGVGGIGGYSIYGSTDTNNYYLNSVWPGGINGEDIADSAEAKTTEQFASGEVAYLLGEAFGQKIGIDNYPVICGDTVFLITDCNGNLAYNNTGVDGHIYVDGVCLVCGEGCEHNFVDGYCEYCYMECAHNFVDSTCTICNKECEHNFVDGACEYCNKECEHNFVDGYCDICWIECEHNYTEGTCDICGIVCEHNFLVDGYCEYCGMECEHWFIEGYCDYCGKECKHNYTADGYCDICWIECEHNYTADGYCDICGMECEHWFTEGYCEYCGKECEHNFVDGYCNICWMECAHNFVDSTCTICHYVCEHNFVYGTCEYCNKECEHNFVDGYCNICWMECAHNFVDNTCTICHYVCVHNIVDGFCEHCGLDKLFELNSVGLSISGDVGVELIFKLDRYVVNDENAYFEILVPSGTNENGSYELAYETQIVPVSEAKKGGNLTNGYMVTCYISAKEFSSDIITRICLSDGTKSKPIKYQAKNYLEQIMNPYFDNDAEIVAARPFVKALLNYGACAQLNFGYTPNGIANDSSHFTAEDRNLTVFSGDERTNFISDNAMNLTNSAEDKVKYYGSSLLLENNTVIRHYFTLADSSVDVSTLNITVDGNKAEVNKKGNVYYVDIENISPKSLGDTYTLQIGTATGAMTIEYSCMSYVAAALNKYTNEDGKCINSSKQPLVNLVASLYDYYKVAEKI